MNIKLLLAALSLLIALHNWGATNAVAAPTPKRPMDYFVALPQGLDPVLATNVFTAILRLTANAETGSRVTLLQAIPATELAAFTNLAGSRSQRLRDRNIGAGIERTRQYLLAESPKQTEHRGQLQLTHLLDEISARRRGSDLPAVIVLVGDPLLRSTYPGEAVWSLADGRVPGDGTFFYPQSPYFVQGKSQLLANATVCWLLTRNDWATSIEHERLVKRFLHLWFKQIGSAGLCSFGPDVARSFSDAAAGIAAPVFDAELSSDRQLAMWTPPPPPALTNMVAGPLIKLAVMNSPTLPVGSGDSRGTGRAPAIRPTTMQLSEALSTSVAPAIGNLGTNHIGLAAIWFSDDSKADIDIWAAPRARASETNLLDEVFFKHMEMPEASLYGDRRIAAGSASNSVDQALAGPAWEFAEVFHPFLDEIRVHLNCFATTQPVHGVFRVYWRGRFADRPFRFDVETGDQALERPIRDQSRFWINVKMEDFFPEIRPATEKATLSK